MSRLPAPGSGRFSRALQPSLKVRIPTPITVHVDQCPQCAKDLHVLRELALDEEQLDRLSWLYASKPSGSLLLCWRARSSIAAFSRGVLEGIPGEIRDHLATCPRCRADVYARRQAILSEQSGSRIIVAMRPCRPICWTM